MSAAIAVATVLGTEPPAFAATWRELAADLGAARPYCGPSFVMAALASYHSGQSPRLVHLTRDGALAGLLPLVARPIQLAGVQIGEHGFPRNPNVIVNDPLIRPGPDAVNRLAALITEGFAMGADTLNLDHMPQGLGAACAAAAGLIGGSADEVRPSRAIYYATLEGDWESYLATRSRNHRWQIRKALKAVDAGALEVRRVRGRDALWAARADWFSVERRSWQGADPASAMSNADRDFHSRLIETLPEAELGDLWMVHGKGRPVAALRMLGAPGLTTVHTMHFDTDWREAAPGFAAFAVMVRTACEEGLREVDMHGTTEFFARWATGSRPLEKVRLYRPRFRGYLLCQGRRLLVRLRSARSGTMVP